MLAGAARAQAADRDQGGAGQSQSGGSAFVTAGEGQQSARSEGDPSTPTGRRDAVSGEICGHLL
jgi:hypothetical protein